MIKDYPRLDETLNKPSVNFDPTLGAECNLATNQKALLVVHYGSIPQSVLSKKDNAIYTKYHQQAGDKIQQYLENGDIVIMSTMIHEWKNAPAFLPSTNVLHLVTRNGDSDILSTFQSENQSYKQSLSSFVELLLAKNVHQIEIIGEFGNACVKGMKDTFDKTDKFKIELGEEIFN